MMKKRTWFPRTDPGLRFFLVMLLSVSPLFAKFKPWYNYYNSGYGTRALSLAMAFTAVADDGTSPFWNPAGLTRLTEPQFYISYRADSQELLESETSFDGSYNYEFNSHLKQIDFFSLAFPQKRGKWDSSFAFSYYRYIPTGFTGSTQAMYSLQPSNEANEFYQLTFKGSEGIDVLAVSGALSWRGVFSFGITLQNYFNTSLLQYEYENQGLFYTEKIIEKLGGRNWIFGFLFSPSKLITAGLCYHSPLKKSIRSTIVINEKDAEGNDLNTTEEQETPGVNLPSRLSLGLKIEPVEGFFAAYEYSLINWAKGALPNYDPFHSNFAASVKPGEVLQPVSPKNHRIGAEYRFSYKKIGFALRGGWFRDRELYTDSSGRHVYVQGITVGLGVRFSQDLTLEAAYMKPWSRWAEGSFFHPGGEIESRFYQNTLSVAVCYRFKRLFNR